MSIRRKGQRCHVLQLVTDIFSNDHPSSHRYVAGVGNDPRASRHFNCIKQAKDYDAHGEYVQMWIPALRNLHPDHVHTPWLLDPEERRRYGLKTSQIDVTFDAYPARPLMELPEWEKHYNRKQGVGSKMMGNPQEKVKDGKIKRSKWPSSNGNGNGTGNGNYSGSNAYPRRSGNTSNSSGGFGRQNNNNGGNGGGQSYFSSRADRSSSTQDQSNDSRNSFRPRYNNSGSSNTNNDRNKDYISGSNFSHNSRRSKDGAGQTTPSARDLNTSSPGVGVYRPPTMRQNSPREPNANLQRNRFGPNSGSFGSGGTSSSTSSNRVPSGASATSNFRRSEGISGGALSNSRAFPGGVRQQDAVDCPVTSPPGPTIKVKGGRMSPGLPIATTRMDSLPPKPHAAKGLFGRVKQTEKYNASDSGGSGGEGERISSGSTSSLLGANQHHNSTSSTASSSPSSGYSLENVNGGKQLEGSAVADD